MDDITNPSPDQGEVTATVEHETVIYLSNTAWNDPGEEPVRLPLDVEEAEAVWDVLGKAIAAAKGEPPESEIDLDHAQPHWGDHHVLSFEERRQLRQLLLDLRSWLHPTAPATMYDRASHAAGLLEH